MKIIKYNPFRILGVYSNASARNIAAHLARARALANVGQTARFDEDMSKVLSPVDRNTTTLQQAQSQINLPKDKIKHALFWFCNVTSIDKIALEYLQTGDVEKTLELFGKQSNYSSLINKGVLLLMQNSDDKEGIACLLNVIHGDELRNAFVREMCGDIFQIEEEKMAHLFLDELLSEIPANVLYGICQAINVSSLDCEYVKEKAVGEPIAKINRAIESVSSVPDNDADENYRAGLNLINGTRSSLNQIASILGTADAQYQRVADNLAKTILHCGICYFNETDDDDDIQKASEIQNYALKIAVGKLVRQRCQENIGILNRIKHKRDIENSVGVDMAYIATALKYFQSKSNTIDNANSLVNNCKPHLQNIKNKLGTNNDMYLKISSAVVNDALGMVVDVINSAQTNFGSSNKNKQAIENIKQIVSNANKSLTLIGSLDMTSSAKTHYQTNLSTFHNIKRQVDELKPETNYGCIFLIVIFIFIAICIICGING